MLDSEHPEGPYISRVARECARFYQDPKNIQAFQEWLAKRRKRKPIMAMRLPRRNEMREKQ